MMGELMHGLGQLTPAMWAVAAAGAFSIGFAKSGIPGFGLLFVAVFAAVFPAKQSVGLVLPMLILGDLVAVRTYRAHTQWRVVWRLLPWTLGGIVAGWLLLAHLDNRRLALLIGWLLLGLLAMHVLRRAWQARLGAETAERPARLSLAGDALVGTAVGFATMTANAAGPMTTLYFLACKLPKFEFLGTAGWFFCIVNLLKVPFSIQAGMITLDSLGVNAVLAVVVVAGSAAGRWVARRIDQKVFEWAALVLTAAAAVHLVVSAW
jgi:hypothetical protein